MPVGRVAACPNVAVPKYSKRGHFPFYDLERFRTRTEPGIHIELPNLYVGADWLSIAGEIVGH